ncbi:MAG: Fatty acid hydroxylase family (carotene hydroxylase/sterol desaturase) [uncultured Paraburkholderia sp.]|nr:MAG: Fatty acid hydroxylase family (carotene hydroxylase/sterol desaturase) [uncultured Paraburkholderia sp.]CAH2935558.1 MAG: Fatty acid hydroxylase family (carotene hydroxylase/sterol desaturase) [uncultured Paraburkholderia sp.]
MYRLGGVAPAAHAARRAALYNCHDTICNAALALMQQATDKLAWLVIIPVYAFFYDRYRVYT